MTPHIDLQAAGFPNPGAPNTYDGAPFGIVGRAPALLAVLERARRVAPHPIPVLITGESGTGKELFARLLHDLGPRPRGPFVTVNCGALARELAESELFGHERGAFTGSEGRRAGWFEEASGGTLLLDEIGELPLDLQPKLLRVLETGRLRRVGGRGEVGVDVRIVASTLRDLPALAAAGRFRADLYHRLAGFELALPPLRERREDVPALALHLLHELACDLGTHSLSDDAVLALAACPWTGNVRELRNVVRRAAILGGRIIDRGTLLAAGLSLMVPPTASAPHAAPRMADGPNERVDVSWNHPATVAGAASAPPLGEPTVSIAGRTYRDIEREVFAQSIRLSGGSRRRAAVALGMSRSTFCARVKKHGL